MRHGNRRRRLLGIPRARTINVSRLPRAELEATAALYHEVRERPAARGECANGPRPCPWVSCRYHLALDVDPERGSIKLNFPDTPIDEMAQTCALDVADRGGTTLEEVGELMNLSRERIRQVVDNLGTRLRAPMAAWSEEGE